MTEANFETGRGMINARERAYLTAAQLGNNTDFNQLTEPYRAELQVHCYRMLGSLEDAEDLVQETLLRAWRSLDTFVNFISFRAWLYKIATNACLDALDKRTRRRPPTVSTPPADPYQPHVSVAAEILHLDPLPNSWLTGLAPNPEARYSQQESVRLAFLVALHSLPPRQRAVLLLRDVLAWRAKEVAAHLDMTPAAVNSLLHRARQTLRRHYHQRHEADIVQELPVDARIEQIIDQYMQAWETANIRGLVLLLKEEATFTMPPSPSWYRGREAIGTFLTRTLFTAPQPPQWRLRPTQANTQPAFGLYEYVPESGGYQGTAVQVLTFQAEKIAGITTFVNPALFPRFNLPSELDKPLT